MPNSQKIANQLQKAFSKNPDVFEKAMGIGTIVGGIGGLAIGAKSFDDHPFIGVIGANIGGGLGAASGSGVGLAVAYNIAKKTL